VQNDKGIHAARFIGLMWLGVSALTLMPQCAHASASLYVDDSGITPAGKCQLESWMRNFSGGSHEWTAAPACSIGPIELSATLTRDTGPAQRSWSPGIKWLIEDNTHGGFGLALATGPLYEDGRFKAMETYVAPNWAWGPNQRWVVNANLGVRHERGGSSRPEEGLGLQYTPIKALSLVAEYLSRSMYGHFAQTGVRLNLNRNDSIDLLAGRSRDHADGTQRWVTLGLNVVF
jgi:hypothetical protein